MNRDQALELVKAHLKNKNLVKHCLAVESCMKAMARRLNRQRRPGGVDRALGGTNPWGMDW